MRRSRSVARRVARRTAKAQRKKVSRKRRSRSASRLGTAKRVAKRVSKVARRSSRRSSRRRVNRKNRNRRTLRGGSPSPRDGGRGAFPMTFKIDVTEGKKEIDAFFNSKKNLVVAIDVRLGKKGGTRAPVGLKYSIRQFNKPDKSITVVPITDTKDVPVVDDNYNFRAYLHATVENVKFTIQDLLEDRVFKMIVLGDNGEKGRSNPVFTRYYYAESLDPYMQSELSRKGVLLTPDMITPGGRADSSSTNTSPVSEDDTRHELGDQSGNLPGDQLTGFVVEDEDDV